MGTSYETGCGKSSNIWVPLMIQLVDTGGLCGYLLQSR